MMQSIVSGVVVALYAAASIGLLVYGLNCYVMLFLFIRRRGQAQREIDDVRRQTGNLLLRPDAPVVTTQIAVFNELNVVQRIMRAACAMKYPAGKHEIQVLDDSTDETRGLIDQVARELTAEGHDVKVVRRPSRSGFKAGALAHATELARGELLAVFDADFVPPENFLLQTVPFFLDDQKLGFVQARWGHLNAAASLLTRVQAIGIDGHFLIEQNARCTNGLYMNFNGTAGVWRRAAIAAGGGWQSDTLTEDLDLSYRVQFAGWKTCYLPDVVVPAELPQDLNALRGQQFRWAKGSVQTLLKLLPQLMRMPVSAFKKAEAILHMGGYLVHPLMLVMCLLTLPVLIMAKPWRPVPMALILIAIPLAFSMLAPSTMYLAGQMLAHRRWALRIGLLPALMVVGTGLALSNSRAILEAVLRRQSDFVRTPKKGDRELKAYRVRLPWISVAELVLGAYSAVTLGYYLSAGKYIAGTFIALYAAGFFFIGLLTVAQSFETDR